MNKIIFYTVLVLILYSCSSKKRVLTDKSSSVKYGTYTTNEKLPSNSKTTSINQDKLNKKVDISNELTDKIINKALSFKGTKYKYGGSTKTGVDCSGLIYTSFRSVNINLPRTSISQSKKGVFVSKSNAKKGDLVFFKTGGSKTINHVGLVISVDARDVKFVHSSSSRGVMISSLREGYWSSAFSQLRRVVKSTDINLPITSSVNKPLVYTVSKGDTLYAISKKYNGISVSSIMRYNNLKSTNLKPGMKLKIPNN